MIWYRDWPQSSTQTNFQEGLKMPGKLCPELGQTVKDVHHKFIQEEIINQS